jgi:soluble lytic murein transglycosylase
MQVYRARLGNGSAPITLTSDLKRGGYGTYASPVTVPARPATPGASSMAPIPNP